MSKRIRRYFNEKVERYSREVAPATLLKGTAINMMAPTMLLPVLMFYDAITPHVAVVAWFTLFIFSVIFVHPYLANLSSLTDYVRRLARDKKATAPDLSFLNNVEELTSAVSELHQSWEAQRHRLEGMVAESKLLIDSLPDCLILLDKKLNVLRTNNTTETVFGGRFFQETLSQIIESDAVSGALKAALDTKQGQSAQYAADAPFNRHFLVRVEHFPAYRGGDIALVMAMHDVTEEKRTEQLQADFVANASHEIRTPLTSVIGYLETTSEVIDDDPEQAKKFLGIMLTQSQRMSQLVKELLSLSEINRSLHTRPTDAVGLNTLVEQVVEAKTIEAEEHSMRFDLQLDDALPSVVGDAGQLTQVIENLVSNAIKYGDEGGEITIKTNTQENHLKDNPYLRETDNLVHISVQDQGEGIAPEHLPRLTERFYRVDKTRSREIGGTGLGLAIVKHILERHGGVLDVQSKVGKGSTFTVYLPLKMDS